MGTNYITQEGIMQKDHMTRQVAYIQGRGAFTGHAAQRESIYRVLEEGRSTIIGSETIRNVLFVSGNGEERFSKCKVTAGVFLNFHDTC